MKNSMHVLADARRRLAFVGMSPILGGVVLLLAAFGLAGGTEQTTSILSDDRVSTEEDVQPIVSDESSTASTAAAPVGQRHMLVSSFACSIPGCNYENAVLRYDATTRTFSGVHIPNIQGPYGMAINPRTGRLLVASRTQSKVTEHDPRTGDLLRTLIPTGSGGLSAPQGLVFSPQGTLLVTSIPSLGSQNKVNGVLEFDPDTGQFLRVFINGGTINPLFPEDCGHPRCIRGANGLAYGPSGRLYVTSGINNQVLEYNGTTGAYINYFNATELISPVGIAIRTGTLKTGYLVVTSAWDNPNQANDFQKVVEFNINFPGIFSAASILLSGVIDPGPLGFYNDGSVTCSNSQSSCLLVGERLSSLTPFNNDRVQVRNGVTMGFTPTPFMYPTPTDANLHVPTAMLGIAYDFASCDFDGNGSVNLRDLAWLQNCLTMTTPSAACLAAFDDDLTGSLSIRDRQVCLARITGVPYPCTNSNQCNDGNPCTTDVCSGGFCQFQVRPDGTTCADNTFCDGQEVCRGGVCSGTPPCISAAYCDEANDRCRSCIVNAECNDNNVCTADVCDLNLGCVHTPVSGSCDDGNACTVNDFCSAGACQAGPPRNCNDNNVCTTDSCNPADGCRHVHNLNPCDDGSVCTFNDFCLLGTCRGGEEIDCEDGIYCTINFCDPVLGCRTANRIGECDDLNPCTEEDMCSSGQCIGQPIDCDDGIPCTTDSCQNGVCVHTPNHAACSDGLFCNGAETCDLAMGCVSSGNPCAGGAVCQNTCVEATQSCMSPQGTPCPADGNACTNDVCNGSGTCGVPNSNPCNDGNACTSNDTCTNGQCVGTPIVCNDNNPCTDDVCNQATGCVFPPNDANSCNDGNACNGFETCQGGNCLAGLPLDCDDNNPCTDDSCNPSTGCVFTPNNSNSCDDGDPCNGDEVCLGGVCQAGTPIDCDDGIPCTIDSCVDGVCVNDDSGCECLTHADCDDDDPCTDDVCDPIEGCVYTHNTAECDDGDPCTENDTCASGLCVGQPLNCDDGSVCNGIETCVGGSCQPGTPLNCDDGNPCTDDSCHVVDGCVNTNNSVACDDGDICTGNGVCLGGVCQPGEPVDCTHLDGPCSIGVCNVSDGECEVELLPDGTSCDDGDPCTESDECEAGVCLGLPVDCDDGIPCTIDSCVDGDCVNDDSACECLTHGDCDDSDPCTDDVCDPIEGCVYTFNNSACDDGDPCTVSDVCNSGVCAGVPMVCDDANVCNGLETCVGGSCQGGVPLNCNDGNPCTNNSCHPVDGCVNTNNDNVACDDGLFCTQGDTCTGGVCVGADRDCSGLNTQCTLGVCDEGSTSCVAEPVPDETPCDDFNACTVDSKCMNGVCETGSPIICDDGIPCTIDSCVEGACVNDDSACECLTHGDCDDSDPCTDDVCDPIDGCVYTFNNSACNDGDPCTVSDVCNAGVCAGTPMVCDDGNVCNGLETCVDGFCVAGTPLDCDDENFCTTDSCHPANGCVNTNNNNVCSDGLFCTVSDICTGGVCVGEERDCSGLNTRCTLGVCDEGSTSCVAEPVPDETPCDDFNACTVDSKCMNGVCETGSPIVCDDGNPCTDSFCDDGECVHEPNNADCNDLDPCTIDDVCLGGTCAGVLLDCDDGIVCTIDTCVGGICENDPAGCECEDHSECDDMNPCTNDACVDFVCQYANIVGACNDGDLCTTGDMCSDGVCVGVPKECAEGQVCNPDNGACE